MLKKKYKEMHTAHIRSKETHLFPARENLVGDIPAGDGKTANFLQCSVYWPPILEGRVGGIRQSTVDCLERAVLWNRNFFIRLRFQLLKSYGSSSGSNFWQVPVPVPYLDHKKHSFQQKFWKTLAFLHSKPFHKEKIYKFIKFIVKCEWKMLNEKNQINNFIVCLWKVPEP